MEICDPCPFCNCNDYYKREPIEDGWWCDNCKKEYPLKGITKCHADKCWEYNYYTGDYCEKHKNIQPIPKSDFWQNIFNPFLKRMKK